MTSTLTPWECINQSEARRLVLDIITKGIMENKIQCMYLDRQQEMLDIASYVYPNTDIAGILRDIDYIPYRTGLIPRRPVAATHQHQHDARIHLPELVRRLRDVVQDLRIIHSNGIGAYLALKSPLLNHC